MALRKAILAVSVFLGSVQALTTEGVLAAPRRSTANVNPSGEWGLFSSTSYNWTTHKSKTTWQLLNIPSGNITEAPFDSEVSEIVWIGATDTSILYINGTNEEIPGGVTLYTADVAAAEFTPSLVASLAAPFQGLKAVQTDSGAINFVVNTLAYWGNGSAYNPELVSKPLSTGGLYDNVYIRHWDTYVTQERYAIFSGVLSPEYGGGLTFNGEVKNLLWGINSTITRPETPVQPFGDAGDYDISPDGSTVAFLTKSPDLPKANYTASYIYVVPHDGSEVAVAINGPGSTAPETAQGASESPRWSPDGTKLAYAQQDGVFYESDRFKLYVATIKGLSSEVSPIAGDWDSSPSGLTWSHDGKDLYVVSERHAASGLYVVPFDAEASFVPENFTGPETSLSDFAVLKDGSVFVSASASWTSRVFYTQTPGEDKKVIFSANEVDPELAGLGPENTSNFFYQGESSPVQCFVYYPTDFDASKKYPLALIIHGGPQSSLGDVWSVRWNAILWAEQGFIVTIPQFTGTPSYGQNFTDAIQGDWGGAPYQDIVKLFEHLEANVSYIDTDRAIAGGASFGGYMTNWIQGQELGRKFKALVTHDGKVNQLSQYDTDEIWFIQRDNNGTIWDNRDRYAKWDPLAHSANFSTPHFIVHNDGDYRVAISQGLQNFNVLQGQGVPSRFLHFTNENHWTSNRENSLVWHRNIFNWIRYWTGQDEELIQDIVIKQ